MLTAMIWRMERRTVVAAVVGGNDNMDETLEAIWADVTIQSSALLPVLRLMALRAMKNTMERFWEARQGTFYVIERQSWISGTNATKATEMGHRLFSATVPYIHEYRAVFHLSSLSSLNWGTRSANTTYQNFSTFRQLQHSSKSLSSLSNRAT